MNAFAHVASEVTHDKQEVIFSVHICVDWYFLARVSLRKLIEGKDFIDN